MDGGEFSFSFDFSTFWSSICFAKSRISSSIFFSREISCIRKPLIAYLCSLDGGLFYMFIHLLEVEADESLLCFMKRITVFSLIGKKFRTQLSVSSSVVLL